MSDDKKVNDSSLHVPVKGYIALFFAFVFFAGILPPIVGVLKTNGIEMSFLNAFDFGKLQGTFGKIGETTFRGARGSGARDGFMFALTLLPSVMLALGVMELINHYGGLKAAQKILTPLLRPLMGLPGSVGLALISSLQSTDAGASMTNTLKDTGTITENEKTVFCMFQFTAGATITNFLSSGVAVYSIVLDKIPMIVLLSFIVMFVFKIFAANLMRIYVKKFGEE